MKYMWEFIVRVPTLSMDMVVPKGDIAPADPYCRVVLVHTHERMTAFADRYDRAIHELMREAWFVNEDVQLLLGTDEYLTLCAYESYHAQSDEIIKPTHFERHPIVVLPEKSHLSFAFVHPFDNVAVVEGREQSK